MNGLIFENLCESFLISSKFNAVIAAFSKRLSVSFLGFIVPFLSSLENQYMNHHFQNLFHDIYNKVN